MISYPPIEFFFQHGRLVISSLLCCFMTASCTSQPPPPDPQKLSLNYTATSVLDRSQLPTQLYFFPPLLCDAKGKPKEQLTPIQDPSVGIIDWVSPSAKSRRLRGQLQTYARSRGYQVISFQDILAAQNPYSILIRIGAEIT